MLKTLRIFRDQFFLLETRFNSPSLFTQKNCKPFSHLTNYQKASEISRKINYSTKMSKTVLAILPPGAEEMEFVISVDVLRRGGITVKTASINGISPVLCSRNVSIVPEFNLSDLSNDDFDCILLPGGLGGAKAMGESKVVGEILTRQEKAGKLIAAICAAPTVLSKHSIYLGKKLTSYPSVKTELVDKYNYDDENIVVHDGNLLTSRGPGTAFQFALKLVEILAGSTKSDEVAKGMLLK